jgi:hypothetical protein
MQEQWFRAYVLLAFRLDEAIRKFTEASQGFEAHRAAYLEKQVVALETVCRKLSGETFSLEEEVQRWGRHRLLSCLAYMCSISWNFALVQLTNFADCLLAYTLYGG